MKSWRAFGESLSGSALREDIGIHGFAAVHGADSALSNVVQGNGVVSNALPSFELIVTFPDGSPPGGGAAFLGLHSPDGVANDFGCVAIEAAGHPALDEAFHFRRKIDVHGHELAFLG